MPSLPSTYKALVSNGDATAAVKPIPLDQGLKPTEALIRVRSVGLNPTDWKSLLRPPPARTGVVLGCDAAGDVVQVGSAVSSIKVGDRVSAFVFGASQEDNGAFAEYARIDSELAIKFSESVSYNEAASFPIPFKTALQGLYAHLNLPLPSKPANKEDIILVWGGSSAVGHHVIQLAALSGLRVFTTASPAAFEFLKSIGAEECFDYKDEDVVAKIKKAAGEPGIKYGFDNIGVGGTGIKLVDAMGSQEATIITLVPQKDGAVGRRPNVKVEFILLYLLLGPHPGVGLPYWPQDRPPVSDFLQNEFPALIQGWVEGKGSPKYKPQRLRVLEGGLDKITEGLETMQKGDYGREKLVYPIA